MVNYSGKDTCQSIMVAAETTIWMNFSASSCINCTLIWRMGI